jgi:hypothetical protein
MSSHRKAEKLIRNPARRLEHDAPGVSASILEGLDKILTAATIAPASGQTKPLGPPVKIQRSNLLHRKRCNPTGTLSKRRIARLTKIVDRPRAKGRGGTIRRSVFSFRPDGKQFRN